MTTSLQRPLRPRARRIRSLQGTLPALACGLVLAGATTSDAEAQIGYAATLGGQIFDIEPSTGVLTPLVSTGINLLFGIANTQTPDVLLISGVTAGIHRVDINAGTVTALPGANTPMFALCNNEDDGAIYAVSLGSLYEIDPVTGAASLIGPTGAVNVYGLDYHQGIQSLVGFDPITNTLIAIDEATGAGTTIGASMAGLVGLWYDVSANALYGVCDQNTNGCISEIDVTTGAATVLFSTGMNLVSIGGDVGGGSSLGLGTNYCTATPNSSGAAASISADGSAAVADNDVTLFCTGAPQNQFGMFVTSMTQAFVPGAGGASNGNLCLGGSIGRYTGPSQVLFSGSAGEFSLALDLTQTPQGLGFVPIVAGETWSFQAWCRDTVGLGSNFSDGLEITFQ